MQKNILVIIVGVLSALYLFNPTAGVFELIPDNLPLIGNLDEAGAVLIVVSVLRYYGFDVSSLLNREGDK